MVAGWSIGQPLRNEPLRPLPEHNDADPRRAALGARLFHDARLSGDRRHSCASCHDLARGGAGGLARAPSLGARRVQFNTPSIYNSVFNTVQSWTGRPAALAALPEHAGAAGWDALLAPLAADPAFNAQWRAVYGDVLGAAGAKDALGHYLRTLVTPSRFDRYLRGDAGALSEDEKAGYARFKSYGCVACHQGINVGGNMFARLGAMRELPGLRDNPNGQGRFEVTGRETDRFLYRVPSLRNVALTAPYFHDGSVATLEQAVDLMFTYQLGRGAPQRDKDLIAGFLRSLSGERLPPPGAAP